MRSVRFFGEEVQRRRRLLEPRPEHDREHEHDQQRDQPIALLARQRRRPAAARRRPRSRFGASPMPARYLRRSARYIASPSNMPTPAAPKPQCQPQRGLSAEVAAHDLAQERADVDAHVEDGEAGVAPPVALLIELPDHRRRVHLEEAGADRDQRQADEERRHRRHREHEVARGDDAGADHQRAVCAQEAIGEEAAQHGQARTP